MPIRRRRESVKKLWHDLRQVRDRWLCQQYHKWYYNSGVHEGTTFLGVRCVKSVSDCWNYQEIIFELKPSLVIEFGTRHGGSALYFSTILQHLGSRTKVLTVDVTHEFLEVDAGNSHIEFMVCSSIDPKVKYRINELRKEFPGPVFAILDSDHNKYHVLDEMIFLRSVLVPGDYLVVEDSNINGHPVKRDFGPGPYEAISEYVSRYPDDYEKDVTRENKFGFTFAPQGFLVRT